MEVSATDKLDDSHNRVGSFNEWWGYYEKENNPKIELIIHEVLPEAADYENDAEQQRDIDGITVSYKVDHYKKGERMPFAIYCYSLFASIARTNKYLPNLSVSCILSLPSISPFKLYPPC